MGIIAQNLKTGTENVSGLPELEAVEMELLNELSDSRGVLREMCSHILNAGGKRIRPMLVVYSGMLFSDMKDELIKAAVAAELIHMASLVHDDVIDCSPLRRNNPSANSVWGNYYAVLGGDYLFAKAFSILSAHELNASMNFMVEAIQNMCHGEILQAEDRFDCDVSIDRYYERIAMKTAIFLKCCCQSGAAVSGADEANIQIIGDYGLNIGLAFQIIDDILDFYGCEDVMGKPKNEDLRQGNITLPVLLLLKHELYGSWTRETVKGKNFNSQVMEELCAVLKETGIMDRCLKTALLHIEKAKQCLNPAPESRYKDSLYDLAGILSLRVK